MSTSLVDLAEATREDPKLATEALRALAIIVESLLKRVQALELDLDKAKADLRNR